MLKALLLLFPLFSLDRISAFCPWVDHQVIDDIFSAADILNLFRLRFISDSKLNLRLFRRKFPIQASTSSLPAQYDNLVFCDLERFKQELSARPDWSSRRPWLIVAQEALLAQHVIAGDVGVHQFIFLLDTKMRNVQEVYSVNGVHMNRTVALLNGSLTSLTNDGHHLHMNRASNLQGLKLKALTGFQPPFVIRKSILTEQLNKLQDSNSLPIHFNISVDDLEGVFISALRALATEMNFSVELAARTDHHFGSVAPNGSWIGIAGDIKDQFFDFAAASVSVTLPRLQILNYLPPMAKETAGLFIQRRGFEERAWLSFFYPFTNNLWIGLGVNFVGLLVVIKGLALLYQSTPLKVNERETFTVQKSFLNLKSEVAELLGNAWRLILSYFGHLPGLNEEYQKMRGLRYFLFIIFFFGNIVFMSYRASLTSELSVRRQKLPFNSMTSFYQSDYRLLSFRLYLLRRYLITDAKSRLQFERQVNKFVIKDNYTEFLMERDKPNMAFLSHVESMLQEKGSECQYKAVWQTSSPIFATYAFPKNSPYFASFKLKMLQLLETGYIDKHIKKYLNKDFVCIEKLDNSDIGLGALKVVGLFLVWAFGAIVAILVCLFESLLRVEKKNDTEEALENDTIGIRLHFFNTRYSHTPT